MNIEIQSNELSLNCDLKTKFQTERKPKIDHLGRAYATGRRKVATARVWVKPGKGKFSVNYKDISEFFKDEALVSNAKEPLLKTKALESFDVFSTVKGGGISGQANAIKHGLARALDNFNPVLYHNILKSFNFLTRDSRMVESKKYGRHKARRGIQFSKR
jgi:small subunit ribosomal protein S9